MPLAWNEISHRGPLESRYRYSNKLVYNNFPWPEASLADLYDPVSMPPALGKAHRVLDRAVDRCYGKEPFASDRARVEFLFALLEKLTAPLLSGGKVNRTSRRKADE